MKEFEIEEKYEVRKKYTVHANSKEEAEIIFKQLSDSGDIEFDDIDEAEYEIVDIVEK